MADFTPNYNLQQDAQTDYYNVDVTNENLAKIDKALQEIKDAGASQELIDMLNDIKRLIGMTADSGGSTSLGSVMAKLNRVIGDVLNLINNMGSTTDHEATESSGSAMAKLNVILMALQMIYEVGVYTQRKVETLETFINKFGVDSGGLYVNTP